LSQRTLVHQRHRRHRHAATADHPRLLRVPAGNPTWVGADVDSWGIDHGTWSVLVHAFPDASIPVVQLSINADKPLDYHLQLGDWRRCGNAACSSSPGTVMHNLRGMDWKPPTPPSSPRSTPTAIFGARYRPPDHFIPAVYMAGLAGTTDTPQIDVLVDGYAYGSLSMTAYTLGLACPDAAGQGGSPQPPADLPPDGSNI
jgi:4,5-DOPA dioxygenase extradiol